jgi:putative membrane protein
MVSTASLMTVLDIFIEPVAIHLDYWHWKGMIIPVSNYMAWFAISFLLSYLFVKGKFRKHNPIAPFIFYIQFGFFVVFNILIH